MLPSTNIREQECDQKTAHLIILIQLSRLPFDTLKWLVQLLLTKNLAGENLIYKLIMENHRSHMEYTTIYNTHLIDDCIHSLYDNSIHLNVHYSRIQF